MCFSPKIKTPKVDTQQIRAVDPAPLTEEPKGILFGGEDDNDTSTGTSSEVPTGGKKSLKVKLDEPTEASKKDNAAKSKSKNSIRKSINSK